MRLGVFAASVARVMEQCRRRIGTGERPIIADVHPQSTDIGLGHERYGRIVAVQPLGGEGMRLDPLVKRREREGDLADLIGERGEAERHAFGGEWFGLAVTRAFARDIGLVPRTTPISSPQSNGMAEAFVRTLKRDYVQVNPRPDARTVIEQLPGWFAFYNKAQPHRA